MFQSNFLITDLKILIKSMLLSSFYKTLILPSAHFLPTFVYFLAYTSFMWYFYNWSKVVHWAQHFLQILSKSMSLTSIFDNVEFLNLDSYHTILVKIVSLIKIDEAKNSIKILPNYTVFDPLSPLFTFQILIFFSI